MKNEELGMMTQSHEIQLTHTGLLPHSFVVPHNDFSETYFLRDSFIPNS
jgi:hypothetical protein